MEIIILGDKFWVSAILAQPNESQKTSDIETDNKNSVAKVNWAI